ncbi:acyl-CoA desaturase [Pseudomonas entomophila]|uniref:Fatty acid desaturase n=1 Tax=Pseudomonas entomophila TaxID=312306 RepID=A0ABY9QSW9_9PSED|nr:fatty acid desaturase [Pseudomonas entomophila]WMW06181.1 fatty acid desaturase [Pseudomonas entomophila]
MTSTLRPQPDSEVSAATRTAPVRVTISDPTLIRRQRMLSLLFNGIPLCGALACIPVAIYWGFDGFDLGLFVFMYVTSFFGIEGAYHRYLAHRAFKTGQRTRFVLAVLGAFAAQGPAAFWVANHRRHHQYTDTELDTHSPWFDENGAVSGIRGLWHAHVGWSFGNRYVNVSAFAADLLRDPLIAFVTRYYLVWVLLGLAIPTLASFVWSGMWEGALKGFLLAGLARIWFVQNGVYIVNSFCHRFGSRPFRTQEKSTNLAWLALPTLGAAWHNNHHAFPASATTQVEWWQLDLTGSIIRALGVIGLAWEIRTTGQAFIDSKRQSTDNTSVVSEEH